MCLGYKSYGSKSFFSPERVVLILTPPERFQGIFVSPERFLVYLPILRVFKECLFRLKCSKEYFISLEKFLGIVASLERF